MKNITLTALVVLSAVASVEAQTVDDLTNTFGVKGRIGFRPDEKGEPIVDLKDEHGSCSIKLRGAHIVSCQFAGDAHPLLFTPKMGFVSVPGPRDFIHGGASLLWPWIAASGQPEDPFWRCFCRWLWLPVSEKPPYHATARYSLFTVKAVNAEGSKTSVTLELCSTKLVPCPEVAEYTDGDFHLEYTITLGDHKLALRLKTTNTGMALFRYREGFHPYFAVSDCYNLTLQGVDGCRFESSRDTPCDYERIWHGTVHVWPGCDLFRFTEDSSVVTLNDPNWRRDIVVTTKGGRDVLTWCQDVKSAHRGLMNIRPYECKDYYCIEPANFYPESEIALSPGASHVFESEISVINSNP